MSPQIPSTKTEQTRLLADVTARLQEQAAALDEQRGAVRLACTASAFVFSESEDGTLRPVCDAWVLDFSNEGVGFLTEEPIETGASYVIDIRTGDAQQSTAEIRVVYCRNLFGSIYRSGARFLACGSEAMS